MWVIVYLIEDETLNMEIFIWSLLFPVIGMDQKNDAVVEEQTNR